MHGNPFVIAKFAIHLTNKHKKRRPVYLQTVLKFVYMRAFRLKNHFRISLHRFRDNVYTVMDSKRDN